MVNRNSPMVGSVEIVFMVNRNSPKGGSVEIVLIVNKIVPSSTGIVRLSWSSAYGVVVTCISIITTDIAQ